MYVSSLALWVGLVLFGLPALIPAGLALWAYRKGDARRRHLMSRAAIFALPLSILVIGALLGSMVQGIALAVGYAIAAIAAAASIGIATAILWPRAKLLGRIGWVLLLVVLTLIAGAFNLMIVISQTVGDSGF